MKKQSLIRKQVLLTPGNVYKLELLAAAESTSVSDITRRAIDSYDVRLENSDSTKAMRRSLDRLHQAVEDVERVCNYSLTNDGGERD